MEGCGIAAGDEFTVGGYPVAAAITG